MKKSELTKLKKDELLKLCSEKSIEVNKNLKKEELIELLLSQKAKKTVSKTKAVAQKKTRREKATNKSDDITKAKRSKYENSKAILVNEIKEESTLPESYNEDRIVVLVRDPYLAYAYWDFSKKTIQNFNLDKEGGKIVIRTYDLENKFFDVELSSQMRNCYFQLPSPGKKYYSEIGVIRNNKFIAIARSNEIYAPSDKSEIDFSKLTKEEYKKVEELFRQSGGYIIRKLVGSEVVLEWRGIGAGEWSGISSGGVFSFQGKAGFNLSLNTELIIYGTTAPNARLTIGGVPVELSPDGKFSIRFYLKDGEFRIPVIAVSNEGAKKIEIIPIVYKTTERREF
ncbi:MAG: DUF4912 domain-containing protein [Brevinematia bacterium]